MDLYDSLTEKKGDAGDNDFRDLDRNTFHDLADFANSMRKCVRRVAILVRCVYIWTHYFCICALTAVHPALPFPAHYAVQGVG